MHCEVQDQLQDHLSFLCHGNLLREDEQVVLPWASGTIHTSSHKAAHITQLLLLSAGAFPNHPKVKPSVQACSTLSQSVRSAPTPSNGPPGLDTEVRAAGIARSAASGDVRNRQQHIVELFPTCSAHIGLDSASCCSTPVSYANSCEAFHACSMTASKRLSK